ncbi:chemotaxis protein CheY [Kiloniella spongiae]|uniref:Chemotaxis protein CheY n=1 Tax=Kiloniella spongiae TaxID=1489064 RepID=A0A0H2MWC9_9PROT|nr:response regulator [Kiloniella spongiae]KLN60990.1 chemotaxis protein CheY [Kiloniella spongiae]
MVNEKIGLETILIVEDNIDDYEATRRSFKKSRLENPVQWCQNGQDAIHYLTKTGPYENDDSVVTPCLILLDLNMPGLDGRKVLKQMKSDKKTLDIPVIVLTTSSDEIDVNKCYELGAATYIQKPVGFDGLLKAAEQIKDYWFGLALLPQRR